MNKTQKTDAWTLFHSLFKKGDNVWLITDEDDFIWGKLLAFNNEECALRFKGKEVWFRWDCIRFMSHDGFPVRALTGADGSRSILKEQGTILRDLTNVKKKNNVPTRFVYGKPIEKEQCPYCEYIESNRKSVSGDVIWLYCTEGACDWSKGDQYGLKPGEKIKCYNFKPSGKKMGLTQEKEHGGGDDDDDGPVSLGRSASSFGDPFLIEDVDMKLLNLGNRGDDFEDHDYEEVIVCEAKDGAKGLLYDLETVYMF